MLRTISGFSLIILFALYFWYFYLGVAFGIKSIGKEDKRILNDDVLTPMYSPQTTIECCN